MRKRRYNNYKKLSITYPGKLSDFTIQRYIVMKICHSSSTSSSSSISSSTSPVPNSPRRNISSHETVSPIQNPSAHRGTKTAEYKPSSLGLAPGVAKNSAVDWQPAILSIVLIRSKRGESSSRANSALSLYTQILNRSGTGLIVNSKYGLANFMLNYGRWYGKTTALGQMRHRFPHAYRNSHATNLLRNSSPTLSYFPGTVYSSYIRLIFMLVPGSPPYLRTRCKNASFYVVYI